jgi:hypothetical protein
MLIPAKDLLQQVAGEYFIRVSLSIMLRQLILLVINYILEKMDQILDVHQQSANHYETAEVSGVINLNGSSDYVEAYVTQNSGGSVDTNSDIGTYNTFQGFKIIT